MPNLAPVPNAPDEPRPAADPFDPAALRRSCSATSNFEVERVFTTVPVRRPTRTEFFRVHPSADYTVDLLVVEHQAESDTELYLVQPGADQLLELVGDVCRPARLFVCINKRNVLFVWPAKLPRDGSFGGRAWADSALMIADHAQRSWVKMAGKRELGAYEMYRAKGDLGEPQWPDKSLRDLLSIAFRDRVIDREDHPVIRELNGEL